MMTVPIAIAPMPANLPGYHVACSAGEMSGLRSKFGIRVLEDSERRRGEILIGADVFPAEISSRPIPLIESVGATGFVDQLDYERGGVRESITLRVRGEIEDDLIMVALRRPPAGSSDLAHMLTGSCHLVAESASPEFVQ